MKKGIALLLSLVLVVGMLSGCSGSSTSSSSASSAPVQVAETSESSASTAEKLVIQVAHAAAENDDSFHHKNALFFKQYVEELSNGTIEIEIVVNAQLGGERDYVEGMQLGTIEMASTANMVLSNFDPRFAVFDLPYLFKDYETAYKVLDSDVVAELIESFAAEGGVRVLAFHNGGFRQFVGNVAINTAADMKGVKVRVPESDIYIDTFAALGANPTPLAYNDTFTALQQGTVDAFEIAPSVVLSDGFYEVCSDLSIINHLYAPAPFMISESLYQSLTAEQQEIISKAAKMAAADERAWFEAGEAGVLSRLQENGMKIDTPDIAEFQAVVAASGLYEKYEAKIGEELFTSIQELCK